MIPTDFSSLYRRLNHSSRFQLLLNEHIKKHCSNELVHRALSIVAQFVYDSIESIRCRSIVDYFGAPSILALETQTTLEQHPSFRCYYHDTDKNSTVGMHLGVDLINHGGKYYPIDLNLVAAIRGERRRLYPSRYDPIFSGIDQVALNNQYTKVICIADWWTQLYIDEVNDLNNESSVDFNLVSPNPHNISSVAHWSSLPEDISPNTLYIFFNHPHTPVDYFLTNQSYAAAGLKGEYEKGKPNYNLLQFVESSDQLPGLKIDLDSQSPNLVIKLGGGSSGRHVKIARVDREFVKRFSVGEKDVLSVFELDLFTRIKNWAGQHNQVVFQEFVPPDPIDGHAQVIRSHILVTPVCNAFLSCHGIVSDQPLPERVPLGILESDNCYVVNYSKGAHYQRLNETDEMVVEEASMQLSQLIHAALSERFYVVE